MFSQERLLVSDSSKLGSANGYPYDGKNLGKNESSPLPLDAGRTFFLFFRDCIRTGGTNSSSNKSSKCFYFQPQHVVLPLAYFRLKERGVRESREMCQQLPVLAIW